MSYNGKVALYIQTYIRIVRISNQSTTPHPSHPAYISPVYHPIQTPTTLLLQPQLLLPLPRRTLNRILRTPRRLRRLPPYLPRRLRRLPTRLPGPLNRLICSTFDLTALTPLFRLGRREWRGGRLPRAGRDLAQSARYARDGVAEAGAEGADLRDARRLS